MWRQENERLIQNNRRHVLKSVFQQQKKDLGVLTESIAETTGNGSQILHATAASGAAANSLLAPAIYDKIVRANDAGFLILKRLSKSHSQWRRWALGNPQLAHSPFWQ